jgi:5-hydroxyisourate hydrolase-like protein (transthyretin family)
LITALVSSNQPAIASQTRNPPQPVSPEGSGQPGLFSAAFQVTDQTNKEHPVYKGKRSGKHSKVHLIRSRFVTVDFSRLGSISTIHSAQAKATSSLQLNLFDDVRLTAILDKLESTHPGMVTWKGHIKGEEQNSLVLLTIKDRTLQGIIATSKAVYRLRYVGNNIHAVDQIDQSLDRPEYDPGNKAVDPMSNSRQNLDLSGYPVYLPAIGTDLGPGKITGRVLLNGSPVSSIQVDLYYLNGSAWWYESSTETAADGTYQFADAPGLSGDEVYRVEYYNYADIAGRVYYWDSNEFEYFTAGTNYQVNDFDIADIPSVSPADRATVSLPASFQWTRRPATPTDNYEFDIEDLSGVGFWWLGNLGYVESFQMVGLPSFFYPGSSYAWWVAASGPGGFGESRLYRNVTFSNTGLKGINGLVLQNGLPASGVEVELRFFDGSSWSTRFNTTVEANGAYQFPNMPGLTSGQIYSVRYLNNEHVSGRLWTWRTPEITAYGYGSNYQLNDFDIADITLISPEDSGTVSLPASFQWTPRPATPTDSYEFDLHDPNGSAWYRTTVLGYTGNYNLSDLPILFYVDTPYLWFVAVYNDGGYGESFDRNITFTGP